MSDETVTACPDCDNSSIAYRTTGLTTSHRTAPTGGRWYCPSCSAHFDEPVERSPHNRNNVKSGSAVLKEAGFDDIAARVDGGSNDGSK